jgi:GH15 family glucan-1,4-alpha-glucosidase
MSYSPVGIPRACSKPGTRSTRSARRPDIGAFTQFNGAVELDASLLMMPLVGFLSADDERVRRTFDTIQEHLTEDGFVLQYENESGVDASPGRGGMFLPCTLWLIGCLRLMGRPARRGNGQLPTGCRPGERRRTPLRGV